MSYAEELRAAAFQLRNPFHLPGLRVPVDSEVGDPLAELLEEHGAFASLFDQVWLARTGRTPAESEYSAETRKALAVARAINGEQR